MKRHVTHEVFQGKTVTRYQDAREHGQRVVDRQVTHLQGEQWDFNVCIKVMSTILEPQTEIAVVLYNNRELENVPRLSIRIPLFRCNCYFS